MVPSAQLLFAYTAHDPCGRAGTGSLNVEAFTARIEDFTAWANREAASQGLPAEAIPGDPHGKISAGRFRRTLAWHIARRPNGVVALAIQYGHEDAMIYDSPHALGLCHYKGDRALCQGDGVRDTPSLDWCVPGCGDIARTD
jgi:hypothetical protein